VPGEKRNSVTLGACVAPSLLCYRSSVRPLFWPAAGGHFGVQYEPGERDLQPKCLGGHAARSAGRSATPRFDHMASVYRQLVVPARYDTVIADETSTPIVALPAPCGSAQR